MKRAKRAKLKMDLGVSGFQILPKELILKIFTYVSVRDLGNCAQLSKNLRLIANDKELWNQFSITCGQIPDGFVQYVLSKGKVINSKYYKNCLYSDIHNRFNLFWHQKLYVIRIVIFSLSCLTLFSADPAMYKNPQKSDT